MNINNDYLKQFEQCYMEFLAGCAALEEEGKWPVEELGKMDAYFANDFACVIIRLASTDGVFSEKEVQFLNESLGFAYSVDELKAVSEECGEKIDFLFDNEIDDSLEMIRSRDPDLADIFKNLLIMIGKVVIESDGVVTEKEKATADQLLAVLM